MSLQSVRDFFARHAPDVDVVETDARTATVQEAADVHGVAPGQIAKTLSLWLGEEAILLVMGGDARIDNRKYKDQFGTKARMLGAEDVLALTGHPVGGVCPFGLSQALRVFADVSLQRFDVVIPAAGAPNAVVHLPPERLRTLTAAQWVDVAQG
jgi:prolyl-tRNA editing enzyme YbaK/EbsC (Cys-tRNA(Pro) deacylase)